MTAYAPVQAQPTTIKRLGKDSVEIIWSDGHHSLYPNRYLRDHCPCASCREGRPARFSLPVLNAQGELYPVQIGVVGRYAISIQWSDRHDSGIYSYTTLREICPCDACQTAQRHDAPT